MCYLGVYMDDLPARLATDLDGSFPDLVHTHQDLVFGVALRVVGDGASAQDVAQEAFVRAYRALKRYPRQRVTELRARPWLAQIALNLARNHIRARRLHTDLDEAADRLPSVDDGPVRIAERRDDRRMWARLLAGLPDRYRLAVAMRHVEGLSYEELAETLDRPVGSVKSDVHRGVALLRAAYDAEQRQHCPEGGRLMAVAEDRVITALESLRSEAPHGLADRVLDGLGLGDAYVQVDGPIGPLFVAYGPRGIALVERAADAGEFEEEFLATFGRPVHRVDRAPELIERVIEARVWGSGRNVKVPLNLEQLPDFERQVLLKTLEIPRGEVRPYAWVAAELGRPLAVRAVGNALARNPIPFVIPCHRVVRSDGRIGNYGAGGPSAKRALLESEGMDTEELERLPAKNVRFIGSETTRIFCYPSCRNARRITDEHRVTFRSVEETHRVGYRACKVCRPVDAPFRAA